VSNKIFTIRDLEKIEIYTSGIFSNKNHLIYNKILNVISDRFGFSDILVSGGCYDKSWIVERVKNKIKSDCFIDFLEKCSISNNGIYDLKLNPKYYDMRLIYNYVEKNLEVLSE